MKQDQSYCFVKARITPEHKIKSKNYNVSCKIHTIKNCVEEVLCHDCPASEGGCKHAVAFLMWLHRRTEDPATTEKACYWKKSNLAAASTIRKFVKVSDFSKTTFPKNRDKSLLDEYITEARKRKTTNTLMRYYVSPKYSTLSLNFLIYQFNKTDLPKEPSTFLEFCSSEMKPDLLKEVEQETKNQSENVLWQEMRYGRITASRAYEVTRCKKSDGTLVENIFGAKIFQTAAMTRGLKMESDILAELSKKTSIRFQKAGIFLSSEYPFIGASPDAISKEFVVEIKSPMNKDTFLNYIDKDGNIKMKFIYQMQFQMFLAKKTKAIFAVAQPNFKTDKEIIVKYCEFDQRILQDALEPVLNFWCKNIFPSL